jgi:hypothetical protein
VNLRGVRAWWSRLAAGLALVVVAVVQAFLHARDCAQMLLSQRHLAAAFGMSRSKVAELVGPRLAEMNGHPVESGTVGIRVRIFM